MVFGKTGQPQSKRARMSINRSPKTARNRIWGQDLGACNIAIQVNASNSPFILAANLKSVLDRIRSRFAAEVSVG